MAAVVAAVYFFRLEVTVPTPGNIYFTSGTPEKVVTVESTMLLPVLFVIVAALFATAAQRVGREMAVLPPLEGYTANLARQPRRRRRVRTLSWLELPPCVWFGVAFAVGAAAHRHRRNRTVAAARRDRHGLALAIVLLGGSLDLIHVMGRERLWSPYYQITVIQQGDDTVVEVNNIFHQSMAPVDAQGILLSVAVHGVRRYVRQRPDPRRRLRHGRRRGAAARREARRRGRDRSASSSASAAERHPDHPYSRSARHRHQRRCAAFSADDATESTTWSCSR